MRFLLCAWLLPYPLITFLILLSLCNSISTEIREVLKLLIIFQDLYHPLKITPPNLATSRLPPTIAYSDSPELSLYDTFFSPFPYLLIVPSP